MSGPRDGAPVVGARLAPPPPAAPPVLALPDDLQQLANAILVVQQRIERSGYPDDVTVQLSRALRRAIEVGRRDPAAGRATLAVLVENLPAPRRSTP